MVRHTFLMRPGPWHAVGLYWDEQGAEVPAEGASEVIHRPELWELVGVLHLLGPERITFTNTYRIEPLPASGRTTRFEAENPVLGRITGRFTLVGDDTILVTFAADDGVHAGAECLTRCDEARYRVRGLLTRGNEAVVGTWAMALTASGTTAETAA